MSKRTTIALDNEVYEKVVNESLKRYKTTKAMSKVVNELLRSALKGESEVLSLIFSKKIAKTSAKQFEEFRHELSQRLES
jgi:predicted CopG family antitoxin